MEKLTLGAGSAGIFDYTSASTFEELKKLKKDDVDDVVSSFPEGQAQQNLLTQIGSAYFARKLQLRQIGTGAVVQIIDDDEEEEDDEGDD